VKPPVVILCGGRGTRLQERTRSIPKPMVEIGGRPILWHVLQIYLAQGFRRFLLLTGYRGEQVERFVAEGTWPQDAQIECIPTGVDTPTGGRLHLIAGPLDGRPFCLTYADGLADIDLDALLAEHRRQNATATMTVVRPELPFGVAHVDDEGLVNGFSEKPRTQEWINGGFFCFEPSVLDLLTPDSVLERGPLERLSAVGELRAFRHDGFWHCMDTYKDAVVLNDLWAAANGTPPPWTLRQRSGR
jgi:glucose-1-phosphate cytidylyltransferase